MSINQKSNLPFLVAQAKAIPRYNKTHMFYLATTMVVLCGALIASRF